MSSGKFIARVWLSKYDGIVELFVWDNELTPLAPETRPIKDWAEEHLRDWSEEDFREMFGIPPDWEYYEILFSGKIEGHLNEYNGEWDEDIEVEWDHSQELPCEFLDVAEPNQHDHETPPTT